ncbi:hypothetical protein [Brevifollis gellanilyticus]|uniref:EF-hand domain-containing protein n=1 Tax=Brevifollis gellanilyticus TaxID=748831 RepID=A0A512MAF6_9BACT|nr:hypothetical protein [Brevifollis gellanilyticus]GEP43709.1 hypothetical protein BGE01nite_30000 [Brevifollis gellanilyticus]
MQIIKTELSAAAQAGALDGSLAFNKMYMEHRELVAKTAASGLQGLQEVLSNSSVYTSALSHLEEATASIDEANALAAKDPFKAGNSATQTQHTTATTNGLKTQAGPYQTTAGGVQTTAQNAVNGTDSSKPERGIANNGKSAADLLKSGLDALATSGDLTTALTRINQAKSDAQSVVSAATSLRTTLQGEDPVPTARINALNAVISAANSVINTANSTQALTNSPIAQIRNETPTVHDLGDGNTLCTWGDSGYMTLVDASGNGVIISPDGTVDPLNGSGEGWKFSNTSTFVLANETKITITPGNPASVLATKGLHAINITGVQAGQVPTVTPYGQLNGRTEDRASNDGHIININGNASNWKMNGQVLGDAGSREQVATSALTNELKLDPTDVAVSPEMMAFLTLIGGPAVTDYDGDGKLNNEEMAHVAGLVYNYIQQLQQSFSSALAGVADANQALADLNQLLELMRIENDTRQGNRQTENAEAKAALQAVERRLVAALEKLRGDQSAQAQGNIESNAQNVLSQLNAFSQTGGAGAPSSTSSASSSSGTPNQNNGQSESRPDPVGDGLRRASRLLSGMLGGGNLNILDLPPTPPASNGQAAGAAGTPPSIESLAQQALTEAAQGGLTALNELGAALAALGLQLDPQAAAGLNAQNLSAGLQALFTLFDELGVLPPGTDLQANGPGVEDVLQQLASILQGPEKGDAPVGAVSNRSLLSFLGTLAQLGSAINAVAPQAGQTTPGQVEKAGTGSLSPQSRTAEQLALVLAGLAALGSAGAGQSTGTQGSTAPTSAELRLGLQSFLAAMSAFGVFGVNQQQDQSQGQQSGITFTSNSSEAARTIAGNFATDPQLLKQLQANLSRAIQEHQTQLNLASILFVQSQEVVQKFVSIIKQDDLARDIVHTDELSDETQTKFDDRMTKLKQEWGVEWGADNEERTPAGQSNLVSRAVQSGMMV